MRTWTAWVFAVILVGACGGDDGGNAPKTRGEVCQQLGATVCDRLIACGLQTSAQRQTCIDNGQQGCCITAGTCNQTTTFDPAACISGVQNLPCQAVADGNVPSACMGF